MKTFCDFLSESVPEKTSKSVFSLKLPSPPDQPSIRGSDITDTTVRLSWHPSPDASQSNLLGYIIEYFSISGKENVSSEYWGTYCL